MLEDGYDMNEIGTCGQFHQTGHGRRVFLRIRTWKCTNPRDGKIVWIDMGMMGRLTERDREQIAKAVEGVALNDIGMIQDAVLALWRISRRARSKPAL